MNSCCSVVQTNASNCEHAMCNMRVKAQALYVSASKFLHAHVEVVTRLQCMLCNAHMCAELQQVHSRTVL